jgi:hypothetical protein
MSLDMLHIALKEAGFISPMELQVSRRKLASRQLKKRIHCFSITYPIAFSASDVARHVTYTLSPLPPNSGSYARGTMAPI